MNLELTDEETAALLRELDRLIDGDRYFLSARINTLKAIRAKIRPEQVREPLLIKLFFGRVLPRERLIAVMHSQVADLRRIAETYGEAMEMTHKFAAAAGMRRTRSSGRSPSKRALCDSAAPSCNMRPAGGDTFGEEREVLEDRSAAAARIGPLVL